MSIKGEGPYFKLAKGHSDFNFSKIVESFGTKFHMRASRRMGMKIYTNELDHMTKWPPCPYMMKTFKTLLL